MIFSANLDYVCLCIPLGICCVSVWRWSGSTFKSEVGASSLMRRKSLPTRGKQVWLEVSNYHVGDNKMGEIRVPRFSWIDESPVGFCECSSTRIAHAEYINRPVSNILSLTEILCLIDLFLCVACREGAPVNVSFRTLSEWDLILHYLHLVMQSNKHN